jgi:predicted ATPase
MVLPLIGRRQELDRTRAAVLSEAGRLVTLVGPGGVGKSTLARAVTANLADCFPGGVAWVDLGPRRDLLAALDAIAIALGASNRHTFAERLAARGRTLTVLDAVDGLDVARNDALALRRRLADWLEACPDAVWLATSRRPLDLAVEQVIPLGGLDVDDAKALFERCVGARRPDLVPDLDTRFVTRLDGLPLAIELYASHAHLDLAEHLRSAPSTLLALKRETVDAEPRHHSLADTVAWSFDRLTAPDRNLLVRLSTVAGRFDLGLATRLSGRTLVDTVAGLERLVASSLVAEGFRLFDAVRCFAASLQDASDRERHREVLAAECEAALPDLLDGDPSRARTTFERLADDLFAAHDDALASDDLHHLVPLALALACHLSGRNGEAADAILSRALGRAMGRGESDTNGRGVVRLLNARARLRYLQGRLAEAEADTRALIECAKAFGSERDQLEASLVMSAIDRESKPRGARAGAVPRGRRPSEGRCSPRGLGSAPLWLGRAHDRSGRRGTHLVPRSARSRAHLRRPANRDTGHRQSRLRRRRARRP